MVREAPTTAAAAVLVTGLFAGCGGSTPNAAMKSEAHPVPLAVVAYYRAHLAQFKIPERRYIYIDNLHSEAAALHVVAVVRAGASFRSMALQESFARGQIVHEGRIRAPNERAIFSAVPGVLSGPTLLRPWGVHSVFLVYKVKAAGYRPLGAVRRTIEAELAELM